MRNFFKSVLAILSGAVCFLVIIFLLVMLSKTAGFIGAVMLPFLTGMAFKTSGKYGLLTYPVLIALPIIGGISFLSYQFESSLAFIFLPVVLISVMLGNYLIYYVDSFLNKRVMQVVSGYAVICILVMLTVIPNIYVLDISERVNESVPNATLTTIDRDTIPVSNFDSDIVVVDFWATWCGKCIQMMPELERLDEKYSENPEVTFIAVNTAQGDSFEDMKTFVSEKDIEIDFLYDEETQFTEKMGVGGVPYTAIIDMVEKRIKVRKHGYAPGEDYVGVVSKHIDALLDNRNES